MSESKQQATGLFNSERHDEAFSLLQTLANEGNAGAQSIIGDCFFFGIGIGQDLDKAAEWYHKAAGQGHAEAQSNLGGCFYHGRGVKQDFGKAAEWFRAALEQGNDEIQLVAEMYLNKLKADGKIH